MINWFKSKETKEREKREAKAREIELLTQKLNEARDLKSISTQNAMYIKSYINVTNGNIASVKRSTIKETNELKKKLIARVEKLKKELEEQLFLVSSYEELINKTEISLCQLMQE